jgi:hypothetical protein
MIMAYHSYCVRILSRRQSGISQITATKMYSVNIAGKISDIKFFVSNLSEVS